MQHAHDGEFGFRQRVIDGVAALEGHSQVGRELIARRSCQRKLQQAPTGILDLREQGRGYGFGRFKGNIGPDFSKVSFGRIG